MSFLLVAHLCLVIALANSSIVLDGFFQVKQFYTMILQSSSPPLGSTGDIAFSTPFPSTPQLTGVLPVVHYHQSFFSIDFYIKFETTSTKTTYTLFFTNLYSILTSHSYLQVTIMAFHPNLFPNLVYTTQKTFYSDQIDEQFCGEPIPNQPGGLINTFFNGIRVNKSEGYRLQVNLDSMIINSTCYKITHTTYFDGKQSDYLVISILIVNIYPVYGVKTGYISLSGPSQYLDIPTAQPNSYLLVGLSQFIITQSLTVITLDSNRKVGWNITTLICFDHAFFYFYDYTSFSPTFSNLDTMCQQFFCYCQTFPPNPKNPDSENQINPPIIPTNSDSVFTPSYSYKAGQILAYIYLGLFILSMPSCKLLGIQSIFIIQLSYYSFISIKTQNYPFNQLKQMSIINGWNCLFQNQPQITIPLQYSLLGIKSNFLSNLNLMIFCLAISPFMSLVLYLAGKISKSYKHRPRLIRQSKIFLFDLFFTILLFNSFNIYVSTIVNIQSFGTQQMVPLFLSLSFCVLVPVVGIIYFFFYNRFIEFKELFDCTSKIGKFSLQISSKIKSMYPLCILIQFVLIPIFLAPEKLFICGVYLSLAITVLTTVFCFLSIPYLKNRDNIRLLVYRCFVNFIMVLQCVIKHQFEAQKELIYVLPLVMFVALGVVAVMQLGFVFVRSYQYIKRPGCIDHKLLSLRQKSRGLQVDRVPLPAGSNDPSKSYPKLEFSLNTEAYRKRLLNFNGISKENNNREISSCGENNEQEKQVNSPTSLLQKD